MTFSFIVICLSLVLLWYALDEQYHNSFFCVKSRFREFCQSARRPPASANPASAHFLAKPHFHPNVTFGDFTDAHSRTRIGFRREFRPGTSTVHRTNHNPFPDTWSFSFSRIGPCRPSAFCRLRLKRHASRNPSTFLAFTLPSPCACRPEVRFGRSFAVPAPSYPDAAARQADPPCRP